MTADAPQTRTRAQAHTGPADGVRFAAFADSCLFLDIETTAEGGVRSFGAVFGGREILRPEGAASGHGLRDVAAALAELDDFARGAAFVAGHNLIRHDLPCIEAAASRLRVLALPAVDTLVLSPLAFPARPYHQLVKDYKLVKDERSNPLADARLAARLLRDEWDAFRALACADPERAAIIRECLERWRPAGTGAAGGPSVAPGCAALLAAAGAGRLPVNSLLDAAGRVLDGRACASAWRGAAECVLADPTATPALAYAIGWALVADTRSVLPRWVRSGFPAVTALARALRDETCHAPGCTWCATNHSPRAVLRTLFGFPAFRGPPCGADALPMQEEVVRLGMSGKPLLAILPTSFGKSLCYQLPALARHRRLGSLTIVISPLQALMKDQVDVLERKVAGHYAGAIHGMLTPPERAEVLSQVRDGGLALLYVAPEQLRNRSFASAIRAREIGAWVFDEAHCVSKWGHDFRTDYRYAARFIREYSAREGVPVAPIACFTATAKRDVRDDIVAHFRDVAGSDLVVVEAGVERGNLSFRVREAEEAVKFAAMEDELAGALRDTPGAGIVYLATRRRTEAAAKFLRDRGWPAEEFHAGLDAPRKREVQDRFQRGELRVICATNAFGMGIDKPDVRIVVHADVPGSLENYLQEAGRAGRDDLPSLCVLLWAPADLDVQFGLLARSRLQQRDISQILGAIRRARHERSDEIVVTPRELLRDDRTDVSFDAADRDARTKVYAAVAWLERDEFVVRDENHTRVFQGRPKVRNVAEAEQRMESLGLSLAQRERWMRILQALFAADERQGLDLDELAEAAGMTSAPETPGARAGSARSPALALLNTLRDMARQGLIDEGLCLSAFVRLGIADSSADRLAAIVRIETEFLDVLREAAPDLAPGDDAVPLGLRAANEALRARGVETNPEVLRRVLLSLAEDGRGLAAREGSLALAHAGGDRWRVRLQRSWDAVAETAAIRRDVARLALEAIALRAERDGLGRGDVLVAFGMNELLAHVELFPAVGSRLQEPVAALERALLHLHEHGVVTLQKGLAVFRQAMGLKLHPEAKGRTYTAGDYAELREHYRERVFQAHVMGEYARVGAEDGRRAAALVSDYFEADRSTFAAKWFAGRDEELRRAASREAFTEIVEDLRNKAQERIVAADGRRNLLVLAGPGSGKTRVIVHRCAYLLLVERVPPESVLVLCFNRAACHQLRRRLRDLAGRAAAGVQIHTYHGLALRLTGRSLARRAAEPGNGDAPPFDFDAVIEDALRLLRGETPVAGLEPDALRDRLLEGWQHVLVDEYQDVDARQYELISVLAGRRGSAGQRDEPATILAVGDDDQNIYGWRGADVAWLRRFREDYDARVDHLVENFRSTAHVISAANELISDDPDRMKTSKPLRIDRARRELPRGGRVQSADHVSGGRVQIHDVADRPTQIATLFDEIERLRMRLGDGFGAFAVLARTRSELDPVRAWCELRGVPCRHVVGRDAMPPLHHVREIALALDRVRDLGTRSLTVRELRAALCVPAAAASSDPWTAIVVRVLDEWAAECGDEPAPAGAFAEFLHEALADQRRGQIVGEGVFLGTVHAAKGLEFPHVFVLDGGWNAASRDRSADDRAAPDARTPEQRFAEERRTYFVAMTRAQESLHLFRRRDCANPFVVRLAGLDGKCVRLRPVEGHRAVPPEVSGRRWVTLGLGQVDLGFAGRHSGEAALHRHLDALRTGATVTLTDDGSRTLIADAAGRVVGALSAAARREWAPRLGRVVSARVFALVRRDRSLSAEEFRDSVRTESWEVPLVEVAVDDAWTA